MNRIQPASVSNDVLVFVVDDDSDTRNNLRDILELDAYEIAEASCARALLELSGWDEVSIILLDRKLPDGDPEHLLPKIKQLAPQASVLIVTGYGDVASAVSALHLGAADYIIKPINADALRASIRRELSRQSSEHQLQSLFEHALDGFVIFDCEDVIVDANPAACVILGSERNLLVGQNLRHLVTRNGGERVNGECAFASADHSGECRLLRRDGIEIDVEYQTTLNFSAGRNLLSVRDVTERKRSEQRALQAERLAAIGETMTALIHESRNALQRSFACLEMLALEVENQPSALNLVTRTQRAQEQLRQLYEEVRQWAAPINLQRQCLDLSDVWREAWREVLQVYNSKHITLVEHVACELVCRVDPLKMGQVFRNIFENAAEVSPAQSVIELQCIPGAEETDQLKITICDEGPGLSAEERARLFEPFFTTKTKGTGLGMAIAKRIVQSHCGHIVASSPAGASIEITIPRGLP